LSLPWTLDKLHVQLNGERMKYSRRRFNKNRDPFLPKLENKHKNSISIFFIWTFIILQHVYTSKPLSTLVS